MSRLRWRLIAREEADVRYCQGCGEITEFRYSGKVRRNANGKQIFQFEIFKCSQDHTWNRSVPVTPLGTERRMDHLEDLASESDPVRIPPARWREGLEIELDQVRGKWRLDKVLANRLDLASRAAAVAMIEGGSVLLNGSRTEGKRTLRAGDVITILPSP